ncbi:MAG: hypothetical protein A3G57_02095 [Candidatus Andersenbacteria bacterium RIFCSPLOWO2_12_FULL_45_8]|nr:MAG: hypothetical protein A3G57_02095 [Candidatus Andersenbacteria bacterium RIFCSPLOWO2_12_FULL_45_8]
MKERAGIGSHFRVHFINALKSEGEDKIGFPWGENCPFIDYWPSERVAVANKAIVLPAIIAHARS